MSYYRDLVNPQSAPPPREEFAGSGSPLTYPGAGGADAGVPKPVSSRSRKWIVIVIVTVILLASVVGAVIYFTLPKEYDFTVNHVISKVKVSTDSSTDIMNAIEFSYESKSQIDIIDVGMPNKNYAVRNVTFNGRSYDMSKCPKSTVLQCGIEVHLDTDQCLNSERKVGTLVVNAHVSQLVYSSYGYGSNPTLKVDFVTPYWGKFCRNHKSVEAIFEFPKEVSWNNITYDPVPASKSTDQVTGITTATWKRQDVAPDTQFKVSASFTSKSFYNYGYTSSQEYGTTYNEPDAISSFCTGPGIFIIIIIMSVVLSLFRYRRRAYYSPWFGTYGGYGYYGSRGYSRGGLGGCVSSGCVSCACACACAGGGGAR